jgi:hypothetical protein
LNEVHDKNEKKSACKSHLLITILIG